MLARELRRAHEVETSTSGVDALARMRDGTGYDLVLCDVIMPGMSGIDFVEG